MCEHAAIAVRRCPFLAQLAKEQGEEYATSIALAPTKPVGSGEPLPQGTDAVVALASSYNLFHGHEGILPLKKGPHKPMAAAGVRYGCPYHAQAQAAQSTAPQQQQTGASSRGTVALFATISLSNFGKGPNFGDFLRKKFSNNSNSNKPQRPNRQQQRPQRGGAGPHAGKPPHGPAGTSTGTGGTGALGGSTNSTSLGSSNLKPQRPLGDSGIGPSGAGRGFGSSGSKPPGAAGYSSSSSPPTMGTSSSGASASARASTPTGWASTSSSSGSERGPSPFQQQRLGSGSNSSPGADSKGGRAGSGSGRAGGAQPRITSGSSAGAAPGGAAPGCPLRKWLGPMAGLVFNQYDKFICPPAIVAARAALAKTAAVQSLRPQALPVKLVAVAAVVAGINLPCGAVREHFEKFSVGWFVAVHATIPFVAMLRKAVIMPKYAMLVTIAAAVMGQIVGSRIERMRLLHEQQHGPLLPLQLTLPLQQQQEETASLQGSSSARNTSSSSTGATGRGEQGGSTAQHGSGRGRNWREQLAADPEPVGQAAAGGRCGGVMGSLFARLPMVKA